MKKCLSLRFRNKKLILKKNIQMLKINRYYQAQNAAEIENGGCSSKRGGFFKKKITNHLPLKFKGNILIGLLICNV